MSARTAIARAMMGVLLGAAMAAAAQAQSFDGTYKGSVTVTKRAGNMGHECPAVGGHIAITLRVHGSAASVTHAFATYPGTVNGRGQISIHGTRPTPGGGGRVAAVYTGTIRGRVASGSASATTGAGSCHGRFTARR